MVATVAVTEVVVAEVVVTGVRIIQMVKSDLLAGSSYGNGQGN